MWTCPFSNAVWAYLTPKGKSFSLFHLSGRGHLSGRTWGCNEVNDTGREEGEGGEGGGEGGREGGREGGKRREEGEEGRQKD